MINRCCLGGIVIGPLIPKMEQTKSGKECFTLRFDIKNNYRGLDTIISCIAFEETADKVMRFLDKGLVCNFIGYIKTFSLIYAQNKEYKKTYLVVEELDLIDIRGKTEENRRYWRQVAIAQHHKKLEEASKAELEYQETKTDDPNEELGKLL